MTPEKRPSADILKTNPEKTDALVRKILASHKYQALALPEETVLDLIYRNTTPGVKERELEKIVRQKLHNIIAPYLEELDYRSAMTGLSRISKGDEKPLKEYCAKILAAHASTRERIPIMEEFYTKIFAHTGIPGSILDLACGLNPFALPWMALPAETKYHAYDLHKPRIDLINAFFQVVGRPQLAEKRDILVKPPELRADVAFFFKEAHRFEQRQHGCNRTFWQALKVKTIVVSLPSSNLTGSHSMLEGQRILVERAISGLDWKVTEILVDNEITFCIDK
jgi:16S rRNA (guanine(1405)-N(7))-methyltransferase